MDPWRGPQACALAPEDSASSPWNPPGKCSLGLTHVGVSSVHSDVNVLHEEKVALSLLGTLAVSHQPFRRGSHCSISEQFRTLRASMSPRQNPLACYPQFQGDLKPQADP